MIVEYRDYKCSFDENDETWDCQDLSLDGLPTLKALKSRIDKHLVSMRRIGNVPAIYLHNGWGGVDIRAIMLTTIAEDKEAAAWGFVEKKTRNDHVTRERQKYHCTNVALDTPETRRLIKAAKEIYEKVKAAEIEYKAAFDAIPRITAEALKTLAGEKLDSEDAA